jgi:hypothetical protein
VSAPGPLRASRRRGAIAPLILAGALAVALLPVRASGEGAAGAAASPGSPITVPVFEDVPLQFRADSTAAAPGPGIVVEDRGRSVRRAVDLPELKGPWRITARVTVRPVAKSDREVYDRYDRAGSIRLVTDGAPDLELVRFITPYGGKAEYDVDVTPFAPLLRGRRTLRAGIDTWTSPAWRLDLSLLYSPAPGTDDPSWAAPAYFVTDFNRQAMPSGDSVRVTVPKGLARVVVEYLSTGHCTDGVDEDEFVSKANVLSVDGVVVARLHPWRDDCRGFRERNPYCARWSDGTWSSDYSRSGWCPGAAVVPVELDLTDHLTPGTHTLRFVIEDVRPRDAKGDYGYWRVSACLVGWRSPLTLWRNE